MTVREAVSVLTTAKEIYIGWDGLLTKFDKNDALMMDAYGDYKVSRICSAGDAVEHEYEIGIAANPVREVSK